MSRENLWREWAAKHSTQAKTIERWKEADMWTVKHGDLFCTGRDLEETLDGLLRMLPTGHLEPQ